jgi:multidrug transporter EmrE-like cation transporter
VTMVFSFYIFEESLNYQKLFGTTFIILGIYLVVITNNN